MDVDGLGVGVDRVDVDGLGVGVGGEDVDGPGVGGDGRGAEVDVAMLVTRRRPGSSPA